MTTSIEIHQAGSIGDDSGRLDFSFMPNDNSVSVYASVPSDKRRSGVHVRVVSLSSLREIIEQLERLEKEAIKRRDDKARPVLGEEGATFNLINTNFFVPNSMLAMAAALITKGDTQGLSKEIQRSFPMLNPAAVNELSHLIYVHFRPRA